MLASALVASVVTALAGGVTASAHAAPAPTLPSSAHAWGQAGSSTTLVLYDTTGPYGYLGQDYATFAGNLATAFGAVVAEPVTDYVAGQVNAFTATVYLGSTYGEPLPASLLTDVVATTRPVIWMNDNIWQLGTAAGVAAFTAKYGWDPTQSYFATDPVTSVAYNGQTLSRDPANLAGILGPDITNAALVQVLASAWCATTPCTSLARSADGSTFPWAIRSANLTYVGELPFSYVTETDRAIIVADLLFDALRPAITKQHRALVRLEDVSPVSNPKQITAYADYLSGQRVPFSIGVIPEYTDPNGVYNHGSKKTMTLADAPKLVAALKYAQSKGGTLIEHGYTHQYGKTDNPYTAVTADDFEFYRARCSTTPTPPYAFFAPCGSSGTVVELGPVPGDSKSWAAGRVSSGRALFTAAKLAVPDIWETPHYAASAADYAGFAQYFSVRYERDLFFGGQLAAAPADYTNVYGQFFPYVVHDLYGSTVLPENLGDYEPQAYNGHPARLAADIVAAAKANLAVRDGFASFFIHPYDPISALKSIVTGIKGLGYVFVSTAAVRSHPL